MRTFWTSWAISSALIGAACSPNSASTSEDVARLLIGEWRCPSPGYPHLANLISFSEDGTVRWDVDGFSDSDGIVFKLRMEQVASYSLKGREVSFRIERIVVHSAEANGTLLPQSELLRMEKEAFEESIGTHNGSIHEISDDILVLSAKKDEREQTLPLECTRVL